MNTSSNMTSLWKKFRNKKFRDSFVASQFKRSIPFQITAIRKKLDWSQGQLAAAAKLTQGVISRAENPNYGNLTFNSVLRIAAGLDVAVILEFVPFSKLLEIFDNRSEDLMPATFKEEDKMLSDSGAHGSYVLTAFTGRFNLAGGDVTLQLGSIADSVTHTSTTQVTTAENTLETLKPSISPVERAARKPSSAQEWAQEPRQAA